MPFVGVYLTWEYYTMRLLRAQATPHGASAAAGQSVFEVIAGMLFMALLLTAVGSTSIYLYLQNTAATAVREGARMAALSSDVEADSANIIARVQAIMASASGQTVPSSAIAVVPPSTSDAVGARQVTVSMNFDMPTPLNPGAVFGHFIGSGTVGQTDEGLPVTVPLAASATMRYEE
jgi:hypothetical protein